ncbi:MAG TPA: STAS domain-containing protein [bacterium]|nr:STAS domain-containing protein [bacterium]
MLTIKNRAEGDVHVLELEGRLDGTPESASIQDTIREVLEGGCRKVLISLEGLQWINSIGVGYLVASLVSARNAGAKIKFVGSHGRLVTLLRTTGLIPNIMQLYESEAEGLRDF